MEMSLLTAAFLFFSGAICYRIIAGFLGLLRASFLLENTLRLSLDILFRVNDSIDKSTDFKFEGLVDSGLCTEGELDKLKRLDRKVLDVWRDKAIRDINMSLPSNMQRVYGCQTWSEAERIMEKYKR